MFHGRGSVAGDSQGLTLLMLDPMPENRNGAQPIKDGSQRNQLTRLAASRDVYLRCRILARLRRFLLPCLRRPLPVLFVPTIGGSCGLGLVLGPPENHGSPENAEAGDCSLNWGFSSRRWGWSNTGPKRMPVNDGKIRSLARRACISCSFGQTGS